MCLRSVKLDTIMENENYVSSYDILLDILRENKISNEKLEDVIDTINNNKPRVEGKTLILS